MREKGTPSKRPVYQEQLREKFPFYPDKPMRDVLGPVPSKPVGGEGYKQRDKSGRVIRALSGIMQKGNVFKGTF
jgi:hypothetical protein